MANGLYDIYKENILGGGAHGAAHVDIADDTIRVILLDAGDHVTDLTADEDWADLGAGASVGNSGGNTRADGGALGAVTVVNGAFDADNEVLVTVTEDQCEEVVLYKDTGVDGTSVLIVNFDTGVTNMPITPNGGDITIAWNAAGIFAF